MEIHVIGMALYCLDFAIGPATLDKLDNAYLQAMTGTAHGHAQGSRGFPLAIAGKNHE